MNHRFGPTLVAVSELSIVKLRLFDLRLVTIYVSIGLGIFITTLSVLGNVRRFE